MKGVIGIRLVSHPPLVATRGNFDLFSTATINAGNERSAWARVRNDRGRVDRGIEGFSRNGPWLRQGPKEVVKLMVWNKESTHITKLKEAGKPHYRTAQQYLFFTS